MNRKERIKELVEKLGLQPHPEGGYFAETYRAPGKFAGTPDSEFPKGRNYSTAIYYLLTGGAHSKFHRIKSDELWHFYEGSAATIHILKRDGDYETIRLGNNPASGEHFQWVVPAGCWFAVTVDEHDSYLLAGCTVSPGFDFRDFEMADPGSLAEQYPDHTKIIKKLT